VRGFCLAAIFALANAANLVVDFTADGEALRAELHRILQGEGRMLWEGRVSRLRVTESSAIGMTLRILVSSADPGKTSICDVCYESD